MRPMLATPGTQPNGEDWLHEVKWDGMRVLADVSDCGVRLFSRSGRDITRSFPELGNLGETFSDVLLDGEIICLADGSPSFAALAQRIHVSSDRKALELAQTAPVTAMVFDVLRLYGLDLIDRPLLERRATLDKLVLPAVAWAKSPRYLDGTALLNATRERGLEGVVSKRLSSSYRPGVRSPHWIKIAHRRHQSCVVGGWRPESGSPNAATDSLGALLLGVPDSAGALRFAGRVGSGLDQRTGRDLLTVLRQQVRATSPFSDPIPDVDARGSVFTEPGLVIEVRHLGWTSGHRLRQPVFRGIRSDLEPEQVRREP